VEILPALAENPRRERKAISAAFKVDNGLLPPHV